MSEGRNGFRTFFGFLTGAAIGAGLALLFAPQSGKETRKKIKEMSDKVGGEVKEGYEKVSGKAKAIVDGAKEKLKRKADY